MKTYLVMIAKAILVLAPMASDAATLRLNPSTTNAAIGETFTIDLQVEGLIDGSAPSLGAYDIELSFTFAVASLQSVSFGAVATASQLDLQGFGSIQYDTSAGPGSVLFGELSFDDPAILDATQPGSFTLARLYFSATAAGTATFDYVSVSLLSSSGAAIENGPNLGAMVQVPVPLPGAALLLLSGMLGSLGALRRRRGRASTSPALVA